MSKNKKGIQHCFGLSTERGEVFIEAVTSAFVKNLKNPSFDSVDAIKHQTFLDVFIELSATPQECCLIGIMIEQCHAATLQKPRAGFFGKFK